MNNLEIENITFKNISYDIAGKNIFKNISFYLDKGKVYSLVGKNGAGKSSIVKMLLELNKSYEGNIYINNINIKALKRNDILSYIAYCPQKPVFFYDSIKNNIILEKENYDEKDLYKYLIKFQVFKYNEKSQIDLILNDDNKLSQGQLQKINIIRVLLSDKKVLVFDEPTSSLDKKSIDDFLDEVEQIKNDKLILIITHDERIIKISDKVLKIGEEI